MYVDDVSVSVPRIILKTNSATRDGWLDPFFLGSTFRSNLTTNYPYNTLSTAYALTSITMIIVCTG